MNMLPTRRLSGEADVRRVEMLFARLPSSVVTGLIGVLLCFFVLFGIKELDLLKAWAAYMLSVLTVRVWIWHMFGKADRQSAQIGRWEWSFAGGAFLTSIGWGVLFGPLFPPMAHHDAQMFIVLAVVVIAFAGSVFLAMSNIAFWLFFIPILIPPIVHYTSSGRQLASWVLAAAIGGIAVVIISQRTLYHAATGNLQRSTEAETLLEEQQAIFESSPLGIAVIDDRHVIKCNARLGDMLGRRIQELTTATLQAHFVSAEEAEQFIADRAHAFDKGHLAQGMYRLRRADGSQFWAEFSGRRMAGGATRSVWMISDVTLRVANERRAHPRDEAPTTR